MARIMRRRSVNNVIVTTERPLLEWCRECGWVVMELPNRGGRCTRRGRARGWRVACVFAAGLLLFGCAPPWVVPPVPGIDVVLSEDTPVFTAVAREIARRHGGPVETHQLGDDEQRQHAVQRRLQESAKPVVVAVGLGAALLASRLAGKQVVFCQV